MSKKKVSKRIILSLIKDDLTNMRMVHGLNKLGLTADDYTLNLSSTIFDLMGINKHDPLTERLLEKYIELSKRTIELTDEELNTELNQLVNEVFEMLIEAKKIFFEKKN